MADESPPDHVLSESENGVHAVEEIRIPGMAIRGENARAATAAHGGTARRRLVGCVVLLLSVVLEGCAPPSSRKDAADAAPARPLVWPAPPDAARFVFETQLRSAADIAPQPTAEEALRRRLTGEKAAERQPAFEKISAVAARFGRIYVTDAVMRRVIAFDVPRRRLFHFGLRAPGQLEKPMAVAVDAKQNVYVADAGRRQVVVYDGLGLYQRAVGDPSDLVRPTGVAVSSDGERIYVVDRANNDSDLHRVLMFDKDGRKLRELGRRGSGHGEFNVPVQAAVAPDGKLYVLDAGNFRVQVFDADGGYLRSFGASGDTAGSFARPRGIAVDAAGRVYVSDAFFGNFQVFDAEGRLLLAIGRQSSEDEPGRYGLISGLSVDETGRVYVADQLFNKIEVIRPVSVPPA